jgi:hypothetical protein
MRTSEASASELGRAQEPMPVVTSVGVRWDAVVAPQTTKRSPPPVGRPICNSAQTIQVHLQLFGALATCCPRRSLCFEQPPGTTILNVLLAAEERLGASLLVHILDESGAKRRHCRLFVGGYAVEDLRTPLDGAIGRAEIDIILLIAPEGG